MSGKWGSSDLVAGKVVVVAVKGSKEIPKTALVWALTHVVQPGDCIKLLVVFPAHSSCNKTRSFSIFGSDCASSHRKLISGAKLEQRDDITDSCSELLSQLHDIYDPEKMKIRVKIVSGSPSGAVATEARNAQSNWVILDKNLKHEKKYCMENLECNLVVMKKSKPKVLRLNLNGSFPTKQAELSISLPYVLEDSSKEFDGLCEFNKLKGPSVTPASSPEHGLSLTTTDIGTSSVSSSDLGTSPSFISGVFGKEKKEHLLIAGENEGIYESDSDMDIEKLRSRSKGSYSCSWVRDVLSSSGELSRRFVSRSIASTYKSLLANLSNLDQDPDVEVLNYRFNLNLSRSVREAISLSTNVPAGPPPLCSICQHKTPAFGNPPKWFNYAELEHATDGFADENFLAEGGFGSVFRGVLPDGQVVAVKQYKLASSQGDQEFCSEVEILSCAQHRNVVTLIGFSIEDGRRLLVYEFICNGSLDSHLFGSEREPLNWSARQKIAIGAARGLRYLHEECRVGCIVHRDMRPNNILLTHDFEPLVGDFGLARWQPRGDLAVETRIIGTFGYLAPEYVQSGEITDKADVYSFGVVLIELITGRKAVDVNRPKGQQCLTEWARPFLEKQAIDELIDKNLKNSYPEEEVYRMMLCASRCIQRDPLSRPRMSQVVRTLEGDIIRSPRKST